MLFIPHGVKTYFDCGRKAISLCFNVVMLNVETVIVVNFEPVIIVNSFRRNRSYYKSLSGLL